MAEKRKICIVTGTRAEFGLLYWLANYINDDADLELLLVVTGMHLSPEFGLTFKEIEKEFRINKKVEILLSSDTPVGIAKSMSLAMAGLAEAFTELKPEIIVLLGDRFEIFAAAGAATVCRIPIAHLNGGEATEGATDEAFRHSITKMAHLHFASTEVYRKRIIQLGEQPQNVFNTGSTGLDNIKKLKLFSREDFERSIDFKLGNKNLLVTFHPVTLDNQTAEKQFSELLKALDSLNDFNIIFTKPNADTDGRIIIKLIDEWVNKNSKRSVAFISLGQLRYLSAIQYMDAVVGNSSSGIIEVPSFKKPTVNIGDRQKGRLTAESIINCEPEKTSIIKAIERAVSEPFKSKLMDYKSPYGDGNASEKIYKILKSADLTNILKKEFNDINYS